MNILMSKVGGMKSVKYIKTDAPSRPYISIPFNALVHNAGKRVRDLVL